MKVTETFQVGGYSNKTQAEQECRDFSRPEVFRNRSAFFPNPIDHKVRVHTVNATVKPWVKSPSPFNQFFIELNIEVEGDESKIKTWCSAVKNALRVNVLSPSSLGDRAKHLQETGRAAPTGAPRTTSVPAPGVFPGDRAKHLAERGIAPAKKEGAKA